MNIKELETLTGVTKQNIRFYERKGLLRPVRNPQNDYREYTSEDVERLRRIKIFRELDMSIENIKGILDKKVPMEVLVKEHLNHLREEEKHLKSSVEICQTLLNQDIETVNAAAILDRMGELEKQGGTFKRIVDDYKRVTAGEQKKEFSFMPDTMVQNPAEFTEALFQYADEQQLGLVITKESMYPEFELEGVEYTANRSFSRFGAVISCKMTHPEEADAVEVPEKARQRYKWIHRLTGPAIVLVCLLSITMSGGVSLLSVLSAIVITAVILGLDYLYYKSW